MKAELHEISVKFGTFCAVNNVSLSFAPGEIHALVGENGAGKSTAMSVLFGLNTDYQGNILINDQLRRWKSPADAISAGLGMVHQHFMLQETMSVLENVILCSEPVNKLGFVSFAAAAKSVQNLIDSYDLQIDQTQKVGELSVGQRQAVEILKLLYRRSEFLILDEPTAVLTPNEKEELFQSLSNFKASGKSIILITHKIDEVMMIADKVSVMRSGNLISSKLLKNTSKNEIQQNIIGGSLPKPIKRKQMHPKDISFEMQKVIIPGLATRRKPISLKVYLGEIVGIAGVSGNGQGPLVEAIVGLRNILSGNMLLSNENISDQDVSARRKIGLSYIPEDRQRVGLALDASVLENSCVSQMRNKQFSNGYFFNLQHLCKFSEQLVSEYDIRVGSVKSKVRTMSGGNKQKLVVARELEQKKQLVIAENPTWGVDIGAINKIHQELIKMRDMGHAILLVSNEIEEIMGLSDRIHVMANGQLSESLNSDQVTANKLGELMLSRNEPALSEKLEMMQP
ncbi:MAG: ABC transporter [Rhodobiaceae bacterium]|nr:ABC transporter [Rhodobiaceae bacterium]